MGKDEERRSIEIRKNLCKQTSKKPPALPTEKKTENNLRANMPGYTHCQEERIFVDDWRWPRYVHPWFTRVLTVALAISTNNLTPNVWSVTAHCVGISATSVNVHITRVAPILTWLALKEGVMLSNLCCLTRISSIHLVNTLHANVAEPLQHSQKRWRLRGTQASFLPTSFWL